MRVLVSNYNPLEYKTEVLCIGFFKNEVLGGLKEELNHHLHGIVEKLMSEKVFEGEYKQLYLIHTLEKLRSERILLVGLGEESKLNLERLRRVSGVAAKYVRDLGLREFSTILQTIQIPDTTIQKRTRAVVEGTTLGLYQFTKYKTSDIPKTVESLTIIEQENFEACKSAADVASIIAETVNVVRDIVNSPANEITPERLAEESRRVAQENGLRITVFGKEEMKSMGMNSLLSVSLGSAKEPKLIILEHNPPGPKATIAVVGKGITFDSGGLDLKTTEHMQEMKSDKAGAVTVLGLMNIASKLNIPIRLIGVMPCTENMPGGNASKPRDVVKAYNGKTIEIMNTDAEGRLVLADALSYTEKTYQPDAIIDLATLTGAVIMALGYYTAALLGNDPNLMEKIRKAAEATSENVWPLPLNEDYKDLVKSEVADVRNSSPAGVPGPGTINGASFLSNFIEHTPWAHLDIAGTAWWEKEGEYNQKGATGFGIRLLTDLLINWDKY